MDLMENFQETIDENLLWILPYPILLSHCPSLWWLNLFFMFKPLSLMLKTMLNHVNPYVWWFKTTIVEGQKWKVHLDVGLSDSKNMQSMLEISWRSFYLHVELGQNRQFPHIFLGQTIPFFSLILLVSEDFHLPGLVNCPRKRTGKIHHFLWLNLAKSTISKRPFPSSQTVDITRGLSDLPVFYIFLLSPSLRLDAKFCQHSHHSRFQQALHGFSDGIDLPGPLRMSMLCRWVPSGK